LVALIAAAIGTFCAFAVFWRLPTAWLSGTAAAGGIALINSIGNLADFGGPYLVGWIKDLTGSASIGLMVLAVMPLLAACLVLLSRDETGVEFGGQAGAK
jgi:nitrate/nitrite transporter NarK